MDEQRIIDDRAVSEIIGYILIFGMVMVSISSIMIIGTSGLTDARDSEQISNAEDAFEILAENIAEHTNDRAVGRATEIRVSDASLSFGPEEKYYVNVTEGGEKEVYLMTGEPIIYETNQGSKVVYSNSALFRENSHGDWMIREPNLRISDDRSILPQTMISGTDDQITVGGSQSVLVRTEQRTPRLYQNTSVGVNIEIVTYDARAEAWKTFLDSHDKLECETDVLSDGRTSVTCDEFTTDEVYIPVTRLTGEFS